MSIFGTVLTSFTGARSATSINSNSINVPADALIIAGVTAGAPGSAPTLAISDGTNTYTPRTMQGPTGFGNYQQLFYCLSAAANASTVLNATSGGVACNWLNLAVWVVDLSAPCSFDTDAGFGSGSGGTVTSASFSTTGSDEFCACFIDDGGFGTGGWSANNGWNTDSASYGTFDAACSTTFSAPQTGITGSMSNGHSSGGGSLAIAFSSGSAPPSPGGSAVVCVMQ